MPIINQIVSGGGTTPTGTKSITANGVYDVTNFASADVQVPTTAPELYRVFRSNNGKLSNSTSTQFIKLPNTITDIDEYCMYQAYKGSSNSSLYGVVDLSNLTSISSESCCYQMFDGCTGITSVDLSSLITISGGHRSCKRMFNNCSGITSVDLSSLTTIGNGNVNCCDNMFYNCSNLSSVDLSSLTNINGNYICNYMFGNCTSLTTINMSALITALGDRCCESMFRDCTNLETVNLSSLRTTQSSFYMFSGCTKLLNVDISSLRDFTYTNSCAYMFDRCSSLTTLNFSSAKTLTASGVIHHIFNGCSSFSDVYFPALYSGSFGTRTDQFTNMFSGDSGCTAHFPKNLDPQGGSTVISSLSGYPTFGGTNITILFDLPSTNHLIGADTVEYERSPKFDTATALAWRVNGTAVNTTTYYTSTTNDPQVGDTIYSDSACTTAVTTISSIS